MKGIILAGGKGTRLYPATLGVSKQLLPIADKPMIYYPLSVLMLLGIRDIAIISSPEDIKGYQRLLGMGDRFGVNFRFITQPRPQGLAQAFHLCEDSGIDNSEGFCLILGDNIFHGGGLIGLLDTFKSTCEELEVAGVTLYEVKDPQRYGVAEVEGGKVISIEEKPLEPKSNTAVTGLYFYPKDVCQKAREVKPSKRGEFEITDLNNLYLNEERLTAVSLGRGIAWLDTGTPSSMLEASNYIEAIENRQGYKVACPEEIAFRKGWLTKPQILSQMTDWPKDHPYKQYIELL